ncbi:unnamed protein product [Aphanomyces euteiches]
MKGIALVAAIAAVALGANTTAPTTAAPIKAICTEDQKNTINQLESTPSYNKCRNDAQKQIFDGLPDDVCAVPSCVTAVQNLVGKYPKCVFDDRTPATDILPYAKTCNVDPNVTTAPETTTAKPTSTPAPTPNATATDAPTDLIVTPAVTTKAPTPATTAQSSSSAISVAITASAVAAYAML